MYMFETTYTSVQPGARPKATVDSQGAVPSGFEGLGALAHASVDAKQALLHCQVLLLTTL